MGIINFFKNFIEEEKQIRKEEDYKNRYEKASEMLSQKCTYLFNEKARDLILACKNNQLKGREQELIDVLFNPFEIDLSNTDYKFQEKIFKICSKNKDLVNYVCEVANCKPEEICFGSSYREQGQSVVFGSVDKLYDNNHTELKNPRYVFGNVGFGIDQGRFETIEHIGGNLAYYRANETMNFPDLEYVGGNVIIPNAPTHAISLREVGGSVAVSDDSLAGISFESLSKIGTNKFFIFSNRSAMPEEWANFASNTGFEVLKDFDEATLAKYFEKKKVLEIKKEFREEFDLDK